MRLIISGLALLALAGGACRQDREREQPAAEKPVEQAAESVDRAEQATEQPPQGTQQPREQKMDPAQPSGQTGMPAQATTTIRGEVVQADRESILVRRDDGGTMKFSIEPQQTQLMRGGQMVPAQNLTTGAKVTVSFRTQGTNAIAERIDVSE